MKHQTDYRKQNLISINRKTYEYVNKTPRLHKIAPNRAKNILSHLKFSLVGGVLAVPANNMGVASGYAHLITSGD